MFEWLPITAEYSNAVLVAILPHFTEFAGRLDLPMPKPITTAHVRKFNCDPRKGGFGGYLLLKSGFGFWFGNGYVEGFASPRSYARLQDPALIPEYYGQPRMDRAQALALARGSLKKLGYDLNALYADLEPQTVTEPVHIGTNVVPYYRFQWEHPLSPVTAVEVEINTATKTVEQLQLRNDTLWRAPPKISVAPPKSRRPLMEPARSNALVRATLDEFSRFARRMKLPVPRPLKMEHVERVEFSGDDKSCDLKLTNGYWLTYDMGRVSGFYAPNSLYKRWFGEPFQAVGEYLGEWKMDEKEAIELARKTIRQAGYTDEQFKASKAPRIRKPRQVVPYIVPRYLVTWEVPSIERPMLARAMAHIEVDADSKTIKYVELITSVRRGEIVPDPTPRTNQLSVPDVGYE